MWILALDTSTRGGSAAVAQDGNVVASLRGDPSRTHGERLPNDLIGLAGTAGVALAGIDYYSVAIGPGSFTGLRVGIATVQALALAAGRPVVPLSTLDVLARIGADTGPQGETAQERVVVWMDGQRQEIFGGLYDADGRTPLDEPRVGPAAALLDYWAPLLASRSLTVIGDGIEATRDLLDARLGSRGKLREPPPLAPAMIRLAVETVDTAVEPHAVQPLYVRRPDAVRARERGR
ncbi:MAG: tRNA (adenosine(37)-N6)-threonylcarbamoyltransferase complex dimerization subunit type 1 TsaB [Acidobacteria bacterium]|nr:tRNA (adenosine(37)-N6)-threonylcarbamoyltransferase complex dimerization subunit type 1 TsaB [Acidobacteriota bacterium]MXZ72762.1 tRNA (adenosine(37)-N6)-threonylcarbamoyltransferase complex dimerization subunit type 1 TsaB [Acidobacteriota bacterium]MYJ03751.1 tRNA (adenosine(37)-N6)-threonylcarbamoyltransferase complex dimerization subunit type 1 TsaB [Acidobacteriota bacterium]